MPAPSRLDELKKRYHENPRRYFAPYANEYRKNGFVDRAILLCEKHLGEQPGNLNGLVVYGQCLMETGRLEEARRPFEMALGVDPENLIALRQLGDIARLSGDAPKAREWYQRLLEYDRRNEEVIALLEGVGGGEESAPATPSQAPNIISVAGSVSVSGSPEMAGMIDLDPPEAPSAPEPRRERAPTPRASMPTPRTSVPTPPPFTAQRPATPRRAATPVDPTAKTVEVSAQPKPPRASLMNIAFDFGEIGGEPAPPPAPAPLLPAEAAEYGFAAPAEEATAEEVLDSVLDLAPSAPALETGALDHHEPLVDRHPEGESLSSMPEVEGIEKAEFSSEVSPLAGLESSEFESGDSSRLSDVELGEFEPPSHRFSSALDGLETTEFTPPASTDVEHDSSLFGDGPPLAEPEMAHHEMAEPELAAPESEEFVEPPSVELNSRPSMQGLPLLDPLGTPTPIATPTVQDLPLLPALEDVDTVQIDLEAARREMETPTPTTFVTETMARVYVEQGHVDKAIDVYRQLIAQSPMDDGLKSRLRELESPPPPPAPARAPTPAAATPIVTPLVIRMPTPAAATPVVTPMVVPAPTAAPPTPRDPTPRSTFGFETPGSSDVVDEAPPADAMLSAMSFDGVRLSTPTPARPLQAPPRAVAPSEPPATGPSAREFFSSFARRLGTPISTPSVSSMPVTTSPTNTAPSANGVLLSPLDDLFGTAVAAEDESAAHRLAAIGATSGPSGGSALDSLFGEGPSAPMPGTTPSRAKARISDKLKFDQFFSEPASAPPEAASAPEPPSATEPAIVEGASAQPPERGDEDDLDQFHGWLKGLTT